MTNRIKKQLRNQAIIAVIILVITIVTSILLVKTIRYWSITASMHYIEEQTLYTGWNDEKTSTFESLIYERNELAKNDSYINWLLKSSHSDSGVIVRDFLIVALCLAFILSIASIYQCISIMYRTVKNSKRQISQREPYKEKQLRTNQKV